MNDEERKIIEDAAQSLVEAALLSDSPRVRIGARVIDAQWSKDFYHFLATEIKTLRRGDQAHLYDLTINYIASIIGICFASYNPSIARDKEIRELFLKACISSFTIGFNESQKNTGITK